jgi:hypothetical protein
MRRAAVMVTVVEGLPSTAAIGLDGLRSQTVAR